MPGPRTPSSVSHLFVFLWESEPNKNFLNFVLAVSEGEFAGEHTSFYDLFRIENGKIAEHWDVIETILPENEWKNANGKFGF